MKSNNIPPYILCKDANLARQVLEKIERESDLRWTGSGKEKPIQYIPYKHYPKMVISLAGGSLTHADVEFYKSKGITNFTPASEYLGTEKDSTENCYLTYVDGYLACTYNHKLGEECLMDKGYERDLERPVERVSEEKRQTGKSANYVKVEGAYPSSEEIMALSTTTVTSSPKLQNNDNNNMTKTWETLSAGDYLIDSYGNEFEVLATCGKLIFIYVHHNAHTANHGLTKEHLIGAGYKIKGASEEKLSIDDVIEKLNEANTIKTPIWISGKLYEAIQMLKKLK